MLDEILFLNVLNKNLNVSGIYCIQNVINGKIYIGSSVNILRRKKRHFAELNKGVHCNSYLQKAFNKYGENSFILYILEECEKDVLLDTEQLYLDKYQSYNELIGYNLSKSTTLKPGWAQEKTLDKLSKSKQKLFCKMGHEFTEENSIFRKRKSGRITKKCKICFNIYQQNRKNKYAILAKERAKNKTVKPINKICKCGEKFTFSSLGSRYCKSCANKRYISTRQLKPLVCKMCRNKFERLAAAQKFCTDCKVKRNEERLILRRIKPENFKKSKMHCRNGHSFEEFSPFYVINKTTNSRIKKCSECKRLSKLRRKLLGQDKEIK